MLPNLEKLTLRTGTDLFDDVAVDATDVVGALQRVYNWCWRLNNPDKYSPELPYEVEWGVGALSSVARYSEAPRAWEVVAKFIVDYFLEDDEERSSYPKVLVDQMLDAKEFQAMSNGDVRALHKWILELHDKCVEANPNSTLRSRNSHYERG